MSRTIKFRAWHTEVKAIFYPEPNGEFIGIVDGCRECSDFDYSDLLDAEVKRPLIPLQFTGLQDSKGKDIYEGDFLQSNISDLIYPVTFSNARFVANIKQRRLDAANWNKSTIIGNIYENPELLKP